MKKNKAHTQYNLVKWNDTFRIGYDIRISPKFENDQITLSIYDIHYFQHVKHCKRDHIARFTIPNNGFNTYYAESARPGKVQSLYNDRDFTQTWKANWKERERLTFLGHTRGHILRNNSKQLNAYAFLRIERDSPSRIQALLFFNQIEFIINQDCSVGFHQFNMGLLTPEKGHEKISIGKDEVTI